MRLALVVQRLVCGLAEHLFKRREGLVILANSE